MRLALETRVLDGRANGGWRVRSLADFSERYPGTSTKKAGENFSAAARALPLFVRLSPSPPPALEVTGDLD
jgi:hypothetical protein